MEILQFPARTSFLSGEYPATELSQCPSAGLGSSLYSLRDGPNRKHSFQQFFYTGGCLALARILLACLPAVTKQRLLSHLFRGVCLATGLYVTILSSNYLKTGRGRYDVKPHSYLHANIGSSHLMPSTD
jgi:hypothetical protein